MNIKPANLDYEFMKCVWCGIPVSMAAVYKRVERNAPDPDACRDCRDSKIDIQRDKKWTHKTLGVIVCNPWPHDLDNLWRPITDEGDLYRPGERICGLKDCVRLVHVIPPEVKTVNDTDMILMMHEMQQHNRGVKVS